MLWQGGWWYCYSSFSKWQQRQLKENVCPNLHCSGDRIFIFHFVYFLELEFIFAIVNTMMLNCDSKRCCLLHHQLQKWQLWPGYAAMLCTGERLMCICSDVNLHVVDTAQWFERTTICLNYWFIIGYTNHFF